MHPRDSKIFRCVLKAAIPAGSHGNPRSLIIATRTPLKLRSPSGLKNWLPDCSIEIGERRSKPASTPRNKAQSATLRAMGPETPSVDQPSCADEPFGTRPGDGRIPTTSQKFAGLRSEPPISVPLASGAIPQASATAPPPVLPPQVFVPSYGFRVAPKTGLNVC